MKKLFYLFLELRTGTDFDVPVGVLADIENGEICMSNDF